MKILWIILALLVLWMLLFGFLLLQNGEETHAAGLAATEFLRRTFHLEADTWTVHNALRIAAHIVGFAVEGLFLVLIFSRLFQRKGLGRDVLLSAGICALLALGTELVKLLIPGRHFEWIDVGRNGLGAALGIGLGALLSLILLPK